MGDCNALSEINNGTHRLRNASTNGRSGTTKLKTASIKDETRLGMKLEGNAKMLLGTTVRLGKRHHYKSAKGVLRAEPKRIIARLKWMLRHLEEDRTAGLKHVYAV